MKLDSGHIRPPAGAWAAGLTLLVAASFGMWAAAQQAPGTRAARISRFIAGISPRPAPFCADPIAGPRIESDGPISGSFLPPAHTGADG